jgi:hypothetical protein
MAGNTRLTIPIGLEKRLWPLEFCDCFSYKDPAGGCHWFPDFIPKAVCGTCFLVGEGYSAFHDESEVCCNLGWGGLGCCIISVPINIAGPLGGFCWFAGHSVYMRQEAVKKYNIDDSKTEAKCCCCTLPSWVIGVCYPCSMFQVIMTVREFGNRGNNNLTEKLVHKHDNSFTK